MAEISLQELKEVEEKLITDRTIFGREKYISPSERREDQGLDPLEGARRLAISMWMPPVVFNGRADRVSGSGKLTCQQRIEKASAREITRTKKTKFKSISGFEPR